MVERVLHPLSASLSLSHSAGIIYFITRLNQHSQRATGWTTRVRFLAELEKDFCPDRLNTIQRRG